MTMTLVSNGEAIDDLATNSGYGDLIRWIDAQNETEFPLLMHLVDHGWIDDLPGLVAEIEQAEPDDDVADALDRIKQAASSATGKTLQITNGLIEDDGGEEEDDNEQTE